MTTTPSPYSSYKSAPFCFYGDQESPFLAPRGVWLSPHQLIVSDTGRNRVFIWDHIPDSLHAAPSVVLGQTDGLQTGRNQGGKASACSLQYPSGVWSDGQQLIVADAWNHRVLIWHSFPTQHGQAADVVLGQPHFESNEPNVKGIGKPPSAQSLYWPYGVYSDGKHLWIADTGNRRVLFFQEIPKESFTPADKVIGQVDFEHKDYDKQYATWPYSVKIGPNKELAIADTNAFRVLIWKHFEHAYKEEPDLIIGQPNIEASGQNQFRLFPEAFTLNWSYDVLFWGDGLWIADAGNSRILGWKHMPQTSNPPADMVLGQETFQQGGENQYSTDSSAHTLYWPFSLAHTDHQVVVADTGNHRIVFYSLT